MLILYLFTTSEMNFDSQKRFWQKKLSHLTLALGFSCFEQIWVKMRQFGLLWNDLLLGYFGPKKMASRPAWSSSLADGRAMKWQIENGTIMSCWSEKRREKNETLHSLKTVRLVAHHWKKLKFRWVFWHFWPPQMNFGRVQGTMFILHWEGRKKFGFSFKPNHGVIVNAKKYVLLSKWC